MLRELDWIKFISCGFWSFEDFYGNLLRILFGKKLEFPLVCVTGSNYDICKKILLENV